MSEDFPGGRPGRATDNPCDPQEREGSLTAEPAPQSEGDAPLGTPLQPIAATERLGSLDVLRGFAVLGILAMNIYSFGLPGAAYSNPAVYGGSSGADLITWITTHLFFEMKFMAIFSALFGAGLVLMFQRAEARGRPLKRTYYRRVLWLLVIGLLHAYALWVGDILVTYAIAGMLIFLFRRLSPKKLIIVGLSILLLPPFASFGFGFFVQKMQAAKAEVAAFSAIQGPPPEDQQELAEMWEEMRPFFDPTQEEIDEELAIYRNGYLGIVAYRAPLTLMSQTMALVSFTIWRVGGVMLLGMALMKLGVFSASRSSPFYRRCVRWGYGLGLPLTALGAWDLIRVDWSIPHSIQISSHFNYFGSLAVALGHTGLVMLVCRSRVLPALRRRLAAVGRMALSNYLLQTILCTTVFHGYGLGLFGRIDRFPLMAFVVAIWLLQLWISPLWLARFRYGPMEWLWRTLTYRRRQPLVAAGGGA
ncbi:MAG: DUF418 domain-containing protein [Candidatus Eisenbacteria bacterium]|nr:DUF418 domain-containing protein [Candidatus Eisenbacteria bacterium]